MPLTRRAFLGSALAASAAGIGWAARAADTVTIRMGVMKLIHSITPYFYERFLPAGYRLEIIPFSTPTDVKDAVVTQSVDFGTFGIAAAILGAVGHQPVVVYGSECNKGMAVVARKGAHIASIRDLKGKQVGILPGTTQQVFFFERLHMLGMTLSDINAVRIGFADMPAALARGDIDAYVGAEPGPSLSLVDGSGEIVEYPYSTPMGSLNMILATHGDTLKQQPERVRMMLDLQRQASAYAMAHPSEMVAMTVKQLGLNQAAVARAVGNVELDWQMTPLMVDEVHSYAEHMLALKQIRELPDFTTLLAPQFSEQLAKRA
ncbi:MAG TPA: NrtA/SsuA/CpmA family ABC transporter substrate-binding protein [Stellaceae bacterium]|jgi:NitT/TauT family transport system substrate-binding protein|nr:NrtA/SsuA/CpmA family ABC transporter substrate-binding protein [Stellaceae bacterium]